MTDSLLPEAPAKPEEKQANDIAESIAAKIRAANPGAIVNVNPVTAIPHPIGPNLIVFLERVQCTGREALAWAEAYNYVQQNMAPSPPGVPFSGLPGRQA